MDRLTQGEREVAKLTAQGFSNKDVARRLGITDGTVKVHLHATYQKIGVSNRTELSPLLLPRGVPTALLDRLTHTTATSSKPGTTAGDLKAAPTIAPQSALAPSPQPRPALTARALPPRLLHDNDH